MTFRINRKGAEGHGPSDSQTVPLKNLVKLLGLSLVVLVTIPLSIVKSAPATTEPASQPVWQTQLVLSKTPDLVAVPAQVTTIQKTSSRYDDAQAAAAAQADLVAKQKAEAAAAAAAKAKAQQSQSAVVANVSCNPTLSAADKEAVLTQAANAYHIPVQLLQAVQEVESGGAVCSTKESIAGAQGPFQFLMSTWNEYGVDGNGDGVKNVDDMRDAAFGAAHLLAANGASQGDFRQALFAYNHATWYVDRVLNLAGL
jgi:hypothetical protein